MEPNTLVNLTYNRIRLITQEGPELILEPDKYPPMLLPNLPARFVRNLWLQGEGEELLTIPCWDEDYRLLRELPAPLEGTYYLVARPIARFCREREDLVVAHEAEYEDVEDDDNMTLVVRSLRLWAGMSGL
jgi:hypothetical protein